MPSILEKLAALDRPETPIKLQSKDGTKELEVLYIRPTLLQDTILQKALSEEFEEVVKSLKKADADETSMFDKLVATFEESGIDTAINYLLKNDLTAIRASVMNEQTLENLDDLPADATEEEKADHAKAVETWIAIFKPAFTKRLDEIREQFKTDKDVHELSVKAATLEIEKRAMTRAIDIHKRRLLAESIYHRDEDDDNKLKKVFSGVDQVAEYCTEDTVNSLSARISEELESLRNLPFSSAATK